MHMVLLEALSIPLLLWFSKRHQRQKVATPFILEGLQNEDRYDI